MSKSNTAASKAAAGKDGDETPTRKCPLEATLAYYYTDSWETPIHKFGFDEPRAGTEGFVTGKPEYLVGGSGKTEAAMVAGEQTTAYDARIYSHFSAGSISAVFGAKSDNPLHKQGHRNGPAQKRRFLARALELEVYLYLDSLRFWALDTFAFSREAGPSESPSPSSPAHQGLEDWVSAKRQYWSNVVSKHKKTDPSLTLSSQTASDWWDNREDLHQVFVSLTNGGIIEIETELEDHVALVGKLLRCTIPGIDASNRFWAEGLCETVRETTLVPTVFPQLMEALICNIPARLWAIASPATGDMLLRIMARAAASLVYKLNRELHIASKDTGEEAFNTFLDSFRLPAKESLPEPLQHIHDLVARIENINDLIALHAAALHHCFTDRQPIVVKPGKRAARPRAVNGARPATPTPVLCFKPPGEHRKKQLPLTPGSEEPPSQCTPEGCEICRKGSCMILPCSVSSCCADEVASREFMRQLREQQATLNGTAAGTITNNLVLVQQHTTKPLREDKAQRRARTQQKQARRNRGTTAADVERELKSARKRPKDMSDEDWDTAKILRRREIVAELSKDGTLSHDEVEVLASQQFQAEFYQGMHALHSVDIIAGGNAFQLLGFGDGSSNSAIGREWADNDGKSDKAATLRNAVASIRPPIIYPNFELVVCPRPCPANPNNKKTSTPTTP